MDIPAKQYLFGSFFLLSNRLQTLGDAYLPDITLKQWLLLIMVHTLDKAQPCVSEIALLMGSSRQNVRKMLETLAARGFVTLQTDARDKRNLSVCLTAQALRFFAQFEAQGNTFLNKLFQDISPEQLEQGKQLYEAMFNNLEAMEQAL